MNYVNSFLSLTFASGRHSCGIYISIFPFLSPLTSPRMLDVSLLTGATVDEGTIAS